MEGGEWRRSVAAELGFRELTRETTRPMVYEHEGRPNPWACCGDLGGELRPVRRRWPKPARGRSTYLLLGDKGASTVIFVI
jgi:hypothetical protein